MVLSGYRSDRAYDEIFDGRGEPRDASSRFVRRLSTLSDGELQRQQEAADLHFHNAGITFAVYGHEDGTEKVWPFDLVPRIIAGREWQTIERGLIQRIQALNLFIDDVYNGQRIVRDRVVPEDLLETATTLRRPCLGHHPPHGVWCHITGVDLVRDRDGQVYVLEDNLRCPSGVSYVLENREVMKRTFSHIFQGLSVAAIEDYPEKLLSNVTRLCPTRRLRSHGGPAHTGHLQFRLFRAHFSRPADGH